MLIFLLKIQGSDGRKQEIQGEDGRNNEKKKTVVGGEEMHYNEQDVEYTIIGNHS